MARVLIVDDDIGIRVILARKFTVAGYEVVTATNGLEALKHCRESAPDAIITDLYMPSQGGLDTLVHLRQEFPHVPLIVMSGNSDSDFMTQAAQKLGAAATVGKPFDSDALVRLVKSLK